MYLYCLDCDVKVTIMWIKFEKKKNICETSKPHRDNAPKQENHKTKQDNRMYETHLNKKDETLKHQTRKS